MSTLTVIPIAQLHESPLNPRKHYDADGLKELAASLKETGQLEALLVRPMNGRSAGGYEIASGHRRFRAAKLAGLTQLEAKVQDLDDRALIEILNIANLQRHDLTPLDEAAGFKLLMEKAGYDVAKLAARIGLSTKYVYDRLKLLQLIPELKKYLEQGTITAGHAILLARLKPADQKRVMGDPKRTNRYDYDSGGGLFQAEYADHDPDQPGLEFPENSVKARSVREVATYINDHVRFRLEETDPFLFPAAAAAARDFKPDDLAPVYITYDHQLKYDAKDHKVRTYGISSWRRADGKEKSKTCAWSRIGIVAAGPDRGDAFRVCVNRDKCEVHFKATARAAKRRRTSKSSDYLAGGGTSIQENIARRRAEEACEAESARWKKALPQLRVAMAKAVRTAPTGPLSALGRAVLKECRLDYDQGWARNVMPIGRTADDVVRRAGWIALTGDLNEWRASQMASVFKDLGLNAQKIVDQVAPKPAPAKKKPAKKRGKK
jgi:ParB/RepB/Spo0J family partition protein